MPNSKAESACRNLEGFQVAVHQWVGKPRWKKPEAPKGIGDILHIPHFTLHMRLWKKPEAPKGIGDHVLLTMPFHLLQWKKPEAPKGIGDLQTANG